MVGGGGAGLPHPAVGVADAQPVLELFSADDVATFGYGDPGAPLCVAVQPVLGALSAGGRDEVDAPDFAEAVVLGFAREAIVGQDEVRALVVVAVPDRAQEGGGEHAGADPDGA